MTDCADYSASRSRRAQNQSSSDPGKVIIISLAVLCNKVVLYGRALLYMFNFHYMISMQVIQYRQSINTKLYKDHGYAKKEEDSRAQEKAKCR